MKNNSWLMLICCLGPVMFFILAPALGLNKENSFWILIPVMLLVCFMMMGKGGGCCGSHQHGKKNKEDESKQKDSQHGCH